MTTAILTRESRQELACHLAGFGIVVAWLFASLALMEAAATQAYGVAMTANPLVLALPAIWCGLKRSPLHALPFALVAALFSVAVSHAARSVGDPSPNLVPVLDTVKVVLFVGGAFLLSHRIKRTP